MILKKVTSLEIFLQLLNLSHVDGPFTNVPHVLQRHSTRGFYGSKVKKYVYSDSITLVAVKKRNFRHKNTGGSIILDEPNTYFIVC